MDRPFLVGKNLYLRPLELEDITDEYLHWINDGSVVLGRIEVRFPITRQAQQEYVETQLNATNVALFAIVEKTNDNFIGTARMGPVNWIHRYTEHGIMIGNKDAWGKGYGGEVIQLLLEYGFRWLNMHKIYATMSSENPASARKNERIGYKVEAVLKEKLFSNGKYVDQLVMSLSRDEYLQLYPDPILENN